MSHTDSEAADLPAWLSMPVDMAAAGLSHINANIRVFACVGAMARCQYVYLVTSHVTDTRPDVTYRLGSGGPAGMVVHACRHGSRRFVSHRPPSSLHFENLHAERQPFHVEDVRRRD